MLQEKFDFFPLNRALSLSAMDEDSTESKVDDLLRQVHMLVERQKEEVRSLPFYINFVSVPVFVLFPFADGIICTAINSGFKGEQSKLRPPPLGDGLTPSLTVLMICDNGTVL